jgi:hypothetical protein
LSPHGIENPSSSKHLEIKNGRRHRYDIKSRLRDFILLPTTHYITASPSAFLTSFFAATFGSAFFQ